VDTEDAELLFNEPFKHTLRSRLREWRTRLTIAIRKEYIVRSMSPEKMAAFSHAMPCYPYPCDLSEILITLRYEKWELTTSYAAGQLTFNEDMSILFGDCFGEEYYFSKRQVAKLNVSVERADDLHKIICEQYRKTGLAPGETRSIGDSYYGTCLFCDKSAEGFFKNIHLCSAQRKGNT